MTRRKPFNRAVIGRNISEAIEELRRLESQAVDGTLREEQLRVGLLHAYHHLNFAWNVRRISNSEYANLMQEQFDGWGMYPKDLEEI